ncbi:MAG: hypothetical protein WCJ30_11810, partial [Deltaproteobacteria bacterium]
MTRPETVRAEIAAALEGLQQGLASLDASRISVPVERAGDALRMGMSLPRLVSRWLSGLTGPDLEKCLARAADELEPLLPPARRIDQARLDNLADVVATRDRAESTRVAVLRACMASDRVPGFLAGYLRLSDVAARLDALLAESVDRTSAEDALGARRCLLGTDGWTSGLPDGEAVPSETHSDARPVLPPGPIPADLQPADRIVHEYVARGYHARWIESYAARERGFAGDLRDIIGTMRGAGEDVSLAARRWERGNLAEGARPSSGAHPSYVSVPALPKVQFAAAPADEATVPEKIEV